MEQLQSIPREVGPSVMPTMKVYEPLLLANEKAIRSTRCETFRYGNHPRQMLDVYYRSQRRRPSVSSSNVPVLVFIHGGGLVNGSKNLELAGGLAHANIGHFFAEKLGYTTVIPDYRLMSHGARFPSGGEDVAQVVDWIRENMTHQDGHQNIDLFIMGNSAGGVHLSTYLFAPDFASSRSKVVTSEEDAPIRLRGVILLSVPFNFRKADPSRAQVLNDYFGGDHESLSPHGLMKSALLRDPDSCLPNVRLMVLNGTLDPDDEILEPKQEFLDEWAGLDEESREAVVVAMMEGHNHISPPLSLGTGIEREEAWGFQVGQFIDSLHG